MALTFGGNKFGRCQGRILNVMKELPNVGNVTVADLMLQPGGKFHTLFQGHQQPLEAD